MQIRSNRGERIGLNRAREPKEKEGHLAENHESLSHRNGQILIEADCHPVTWLPRVPTVSVSAASFGLCVQTTVLHHNVCASMPSTNTLLRTWASLSYGSDADPLARPKLVISKPTAVYHSLSQSRNLPHCSRGC
jgi:hypothetical protein